MSTYPRLFLAGMSAILMIISWHFCDKASLFASSNADDKTQAQSSQKSVSNKKKEKRYKSQSLVGINAAPSITILLMKFGRRLVSGLV